MIAAEVFSTKPFDTSSDHRKICTGSTVAGSVRLGVGGLAMKARMPIISSGAVSPSARAMPMIVPVRMPGSASGRTWWKTTWTGDAPMPSAASRIDGGTPLDRVAPGDDDHRHRHQRQRQPADQRRRSRQVEGAEEHRQPEQPEDDRRHRRQVVDRYLDQVGPAVPRRIFLQVQRRQHADREGEAQRDQHGQQRPLERAPDADARRVGRIGGGKEAPGEAGRQRMARVQPCDRSPRRGACRSPRWATSIAVAAAPRSWCAGRAASDRARIASRTWSQAPSDSRSGAARPERLAGRGVDHALEPGAGERQVAARPAHAVGGDGEARPPPGRRAARSASRVKPPSPCAAIVTSRNTRNPAETITAPSPSRRKRRSAA